MACAEPDNGGRNVASAACCGARRQAGGHAVLWAAADYFERHDELILNIQHAVVDNSIFIFTDCLVIII